MSWDWEIARTHGYGAAVEDVASEAAGRVEAWLDADHVPSDGGWAPTTEEQLHELYMLVESLIAARFGPDCDSDWPIEFQLVNRNTHYRPHYLPVPYDGFSGGADEDNIEAVFYNFDVACGEVQTVRRIHRRLVPKAPET